MKWRSLTVDHLSATQTFPGVRPDMAHAGGRSQAERLCEAAAILMISRRRKAMYGGLLR
jgi:hypothetical protein